MKMISPSKGEMTLEETVLDIKKYVVESTVPVEIVVGTDSQNSHETKFVMVIAMCREGQGGRFFYHIKRSKLIRDMRTKIYEETQLTLKLADKLSTLMIENDILNDVIVHLDIGRDGRTNEMINEIVGWVTEMGYISRIKPESWCAFAIANRLTK